MVVCALQVNSMICIEKFADFPQLGRFTLRTEGDIHILLFLLDVVGDVCGIFCSSKLLYFTGKTIAVGKVMELA